MKFKEEIKINYRIHSMNPKTVKASQKALEALLITPTRMGRFTYSVYQYLYFGNLNGIEYWLIKEKFLRNFEYEDKEEKDFTEEDIDNALVMLDAFGLIEIVSNEEINFGGR